jgi:hypothetical protein
MLIRHIKTGETREIELADWNTGRFHDWERVPDEPTAGVAVVVPGGDGPPPLEAEIEFP